MKSKMTTTPPKRVNLNRVEMMKALRSNKAIDKKKVINTLIDEANDLKLKAGKTEFLDHLK